MRTNSLFWGAILIISGGVLLLNNLGIVHIDFWGIFGPLLLVAFGAWILIGVAGKSQTLPVENVSIPLENALQANVRVQHAAGRLTLDASSTSGNLMTGIFAGGLNANRNVKGGIVDLSLCPRADDQAWGFPWKLNRRSGHDWQVGLTKDIPISLRVETGAADVNIDLEDLSINDVCLNAGASSVQLTLPAHAGSTRTRIEGGATSISVRIPGGVAAQIHTQTGLSSVTIDETRFPRSEDGTYISPDYLTASNKVNLDIQVGVGSVSVR